MSVANAGESFRSDKRKKASFGKRVDSVGTKETALAAAKAAQRERLTSRQTERANQGETRKKAKRVEFPSPEIYIFR